MTAHPTFSACRRGGRLLLAMAMALPPLTAPREAEAAVTSCTASADSFAFGSLSLTSSSELTGSISIYCTTQFVALTLTVNVNYCLSIGSGSGGAGPQLSPRWMIGPNSETLQFNLSQNATHTTNFGSIHSASTLPIKGSLSYLSVLGLIGAGSANHTVYARVPAQPTAAVGSYLNNFGGNHAELTYRYTDVLLGANPSSCVSGGSGGAVVYMPFTVSGQIDPECHVVAATDMDFGNVPGVISSPVQATSAISLTCRRGTAWQIGLSDGMNPGAGQRRMVNGSGHHVQYELYRDAAMTQRWGHTENVDRLVGSGTGSSQSVNVYGKIPGSQSVPVGAYTDRVTVTVTY